MELNYRFKQCSDVMVYAYPRLMGTNEVSSILQKYDAWHSIDIVFHFCFNYLMNRRFFLAARLVYPPPPQKKKKKKKHLVTKIEVNSQRRNKIVVSATTTWLP